MPVRGWETMFLRTVVTVCFFSNVFPEAMETQVVRVQLDGALRFQSVPPLLPAYNKYMGGGLPQSSLKNQCDKQSKQCWKCSVYLLCHFTIASCLIYLPRVLPFELSK